VIIRNRARLLKLAGGGYGVAEAHYIKVLVPLGK
jgi:hypothetical protein